MRRRIEQGLPSQAITLFAPIGMAEDLTKVQLILCKEIKTEIQEVKNLITAIPHEEIQRNFSELAMLLDERMSNLEEQYDELKKMVKQRFNPKLHSKSSTTRALESWRYGYQTQPMDHCKTGSEQGRLLRTSQICFLQTGTQGQLCQLMMRSSTKL